MVEANQTMKRPLAAIAIFTAFALGSPSAVAAESCGYFAFAGAFGSFDKADRRAARVGGQAWGLDSSDSPNAGKGLWVVARGPGSRSQATRWRRQYVRDGIHGAYVARRCFFGE